MRILITNDDGIGASGLLPLARWARKLGQVVVAAPKVEQSGKSHGIELHKPFEVKQVDFGEGITAYAVDSTPADCVRYAVLGRKEAFDLVISGINRGFNIGSDIMYSGTVSAVCEAANLGMKAIAVSTDPAYYDRAVEQMDAVYSYIRDNRLLEKHGLYNINIPEGARGICITRQGGPYFSDDFISVGNDLVSPKGKCVYVDGNSDELDTDVVLHGSISVMPLTIDRTDMSMFRQLREWNP